MNYNDYDCIIVGAGIFGAVVAERLANDGNNILVIDRRDHIAGNIYSEIDPDTAFRGDKVSIGQAMTQLNALLKPPQDL